MNGSGGGGGVGVGWPSEVTCIGPKLTEFTEVTERGLCMAVSIASIARRTAAATSSGIGVAAWSSADESVG